MVIESPNALAEGSMVQWYEIRSMLGQGSFGITYLAHDHNLNIYVAIKEYLPLEFATRDQDTTIHPLTRKHGEVYRWGLKRFMIEAKTLARFKHPNIVRVHTVFKQNNTAYMVMDYEEGEELEHLFSSGTYMSERELLSILLPLLDGLELVHSTGFIHRDIKPSNIYIREDRSPVLLDFGSARHALGDRTKTLTSLVSPGYAPFEQYYEVEGQQGPWSDIYALGATAYLGISGHIPTNALLRGRALISNLPDPYKLARAIGANRYTPHFLTAVDRALMLKESDRPQTASEWKLMLLGEIPVFFEMDDDVDTADIRRPSHIISEEKRSLPPIIPDQPRTIPSSELSPRFVPKQRLISTIGLLAGLAAIILIIVYLYPIIIDAYYKQIVNIFEESEAPEYETIVAPHTAEVMSLLDKADAFVEQQKWRNALHIYRKVLALDPDNKHAKQGVETIALHQIELAALAIDKGSIEKAHSHLDAAKHIAPNMDEIKNIEVKLTESTKENTERQKIQSDIARLRGLVKGALEQLEVVQTDADAVGANVHATKYYRDAQRLKLRADELIKMGENFYNRDQFDKASYAMNQTLTLLGLASDRFLDARRSAESTINRLKGKRAETKQLQSSIEGAKKQVAGAQAEAENVNANNLATKLYADAEEKKSQAETLITQSEESIKNSQFDEAIIALNQALPLTNQSRDYFEQARRSAENEVVKLDQKRTYAKQLQASLDKAETQAGYAQKEADKANARTLDAKLYNDASKTKTLAVQFVADSASSYKDGRYDKAISAGKRALRLLKQAALGFDNARISAEKNLEIQPMANQLTQHDMEAVSELIYKFELAYEQRNLAKILQMTQMSSERYNLTKRIFKEYSRIELTISNLKMMGQDDYASASVTIDRLINSNGDSVIPTESWKEAKILVKKRNNQWGKIIW